MSVDLRVPITDAVEWEPWLTEALSVGADESKVGYDGGEEEGRYETHMFMEADVETVKAVAEGVLCAKGVSRQVIITSDSQVTVAGGADDWIVPIRGAGKARTVKKLCRELNADQGLVTWFRSDGGDQRFLFAVGPIDGWNFVWLPGGGEAREGDVFVMAPTDDVREILTHLAEFLGRPLP